MKQLGLLLAASVAVLAQGQEGQREAFRISSLGAGVADVLDDAMVSLWKQYEDEVKEVLEDLVPPSLNVDQITSLFENVEDLFDNAADHWITLINGTAAVGEEAFEKVQDFLGVCFPGGEEEGTSRRRAGPLGESSLQQQQQHQESLGAQRSALTTQDEGNYPAFGFAFSLLPLSLGPVTVSLVDITVAFAPGRMVEGSSNVPVAFGSSLSFDFGSAYTSVKNLIKNRNQPQEADGEVKPVQRAGKRLLKDVTSTGLSAVYLVDPGVVSGFAFTVDVSWGNPLVLRKLFPRKLKRFIPYWLRVSGFSIIFTTESWDHLSCGRPYAVPQFGGITVSLVDKDDVVRFWKTRNLEPEDAADQIEDKTTEFRTNVQRFLTGNAWGQSWDGKKIEERFDLKQLALEKQSEIDTLYERLDDAHEAADTQALKSEAALYKARDRERESGRNDFDSPELRRLEAKYHADEANRKEMKELLKTAAGQQEEVEALVNEVLGESNEELTGIIGKLKKLTGGVNIGITPAVTWVDTQSGWITGCEPAEAPEPPPATPEPPAATPEPPAATPEPPAAVTQGPPTVTPSTSTPKTSAPETGAPPAPPGASRRAVSLSATDRLIPIMRTIGTALTKKAVTTDVCLGDCNKENSIRAEAAVGLSETCSDPYMHAKVEQVTLGSVAGLVFEEAEAFLEEVKIAGVGLKEASINLTTDVDAFHPRATLRIRGVPTLGDSSLNFIDTVGFYATLTADAQPRDKLYEVSYQFGTKAEEYKRGKTVRLAGFDSFGEEVGFAVSLRTNWGPVSLKPETTFVVTLPLAVCVENCAESDVLDPRELYFSGDLRLGLGTPPTVGGTLKMGGWWYAAFIPILHVGNLVAGVDLTLTWPPTLVGLELGGSICLGEEYLCRMFSEGREVAPADRERYVDASVYLAVEFPEPDEPLGQYLFLAKTGGFSFGQLMDIAAGHFSFLQPVAETLGEAVLSRVGIYPVDSCRDPNCFAFVSFNQGFGRRVVDGVTIDPGIAVQGQLELFGLKFSVDLKLSRERVFADIEVQRLEFFGLLQIGGEIDDASGEVVGDARFLLDLTPSSALISISGALAIPSLKTYGSGQVELNNELFSIKTDMQLFGLFEVTGAEITWKFDFSYFKAALGRFGIGGLLEVKDLLLLYDGNAEVFKLEGAVKAFGFEAWGALEYSANRISFDIGLRPFPGARLTIGATVFTGPGRSLLQRLERLELGGSLDAGELLGAAAKAVARLATAALDAVNKAFDKAVAAVGNFLKGIGGSIKGFFNDVGQALKNAFAPKTVTNRRGPFRSPRGGSKFGCPLLRVTWTEETRVFGFAFFTVKRENKHKDYYDKRCLRRAKAKADRLEKERKTKERRKKAYEKLLDGTPGLRDFVESGKIPTVTPDPVMKTEGGDEEGKPAKLVLTWEVRILGTQRTATVEVGGPTSSLDRLRYEVTEKAKDAALDRVEGKLEPYLKEFRGRTPRLRSPDSTQFVYCNEDEDEIVAVPEFAFVDRKCDDDETEVFLRYTEEPLVENVEDDMKCVVSFTDYVYQGVDSCGGESKTVKQRVGVLVEPLEFEATSEDVKVLNLTVLDSFDPVNESNPNGIAAPKPKAPSCEISTTFWFQDSEVRDTGCGMWEFERVWTYDLVYDGGLEHLKECSLRATFVQVIGLQDLQAPVFQYKPPNVSVSLFGNYGPDATGFATASDSVTEGELQTFTVVYEDEVDYESGTGCKSVAVVKRKWTATDSCGNSNAYTQEIKITRPQPGPFGRASGHQLSAALAKLERVSSEGTMMLDEKDFPRAAREVTEISEALQALTHFRTGPKKQTCSTLARCETVERSRSPPVQVFFEGGESMLTLRGEGKLYNVFDLTLEQWMYAAPGGSREGGVLTIDAAGFVIVNVRYTGSSAAAALSSKASLRSVRFAKRSEGAAFLLFNLKQACKGEEGCEDVPWRGYSHHGINRTVLEKAGAGADTGFLRRGSQEVELRLEGGTLDGSLSISDPRAKLVLKDMTVNGQVLLDVRVVEAYDVVLSGMLKANEQCGFGLPCVTTQAQQQQQPLQSTPKVTAEAAEAAGKSIATLSLEVSVPMLDVGVESQSWKGHRRLFQTEACTSGCFCSASFGAISISGLKRVEEFTSRKGVVKARKEKGGTWTVDVVEEAGISWSFDTVLKDILPNIYVSSAEGALDVRIKSSGFIRRPEVEARLMAARQEAEKTAMRASEAERRAEQASRKSTDLKMKAEEATEREEQLRLVSSSSSSSSPYASVQDQTERVATAVEAETLRVAARTAETEAASALFLSLEAERFADAARLEVEGLEQLLLFHLGTTDLASCLPSSWEDVEPGVVRKRASGSADSYPLLHTQGPLCPKASTRCLVKKAIVTVSEGYRKGEDSLLCADCDLTFDAVWDADKGVLTLTAKGSTGLGTTSAKTSVSLVRHRSTNPSSSTVKRFSVEYVYEEAAQSAIGTKHFNPTNGHYYAALSSEKTWHQAQELCSHARNDFLGMVGYLATVTDNEEWEYLKGTVLDTTVYHWVGGSDEGEEGEFRWVTGPEGCPPYDTSFNTDHRSSCEVPLQQGRGTSLWAGFPWKSGEPNNFETEEHMIVMNGEGANDLRVARKRKAVCEWGGVFRSAVEVSYPFLGKSLCDDETNACKGQTSAVRASVSAGYAPGVDSLSCGKVCEDEGIEETWNVEEGVLTLRADRTLETYNKLLPQLRFESVESQAESKRFSVHHVSSSDIGNKMFNPSNGHFYEAVSSVPSSFDSAQQACSRPSNDFLGMVGYLATVTTNEESDFLRSILPAGASSVIRFFIGGSDEGSEGNWKWVTGPEGCPPYDTTDTGSTRSSCSKPFGSAGTAFWPGFPWAGNEPDGQRRENAVQMLTVGASDVTASSAPHRGYACEWGGVSRQGVATEPIIKTPFLGQQLCGNEAACAVRVSIVRVVVYLGYVKGADTLSCTGRCQRIGVESAWDVKEGVLTFRGEGTLGTYSEMLSLVRFESDSAEGDKGFSVWTGKGGEEKVFNPSNGHFYSVASSLSTWCEAQRLCSDPGNDFLGMVGYLATVSDKDEWEFLKEEVLPDNEDYWVGGSDEGEEGKFRWVTGPEGCPPYDTRHMLRSSCSAPFKKGDGTLFTSDFPWKRNEPSNSGRGEHHAEVDTKGGNDDSGNKRQKVVCEWGGVRSTETESKWVVRMRDTFGNVDKRVVDRPPRSKRLELKALVSSSVLEVEIEDASKLPAIITEAVVDLNGEKMQLDGVQPDLMDGEKDDGEAAAVFEEHPGEPGASRVWLREKAARLRFETSIQPASSHRFRITCTYVAYAEGKVQKVGEESVVVNDLPSLPSVVSVPGVGSNLVKVEVESLDESSSRSHWGIETVEVGNYRRQLSRHGYGSISSGKVGYGSADAATWSDFENYVFFKFKKGVDTSGTFEFVLIYSDEDEHMVEVTVEGYETEVEVIVPTGRSSDNLATIMVDDQVSPRPSSWGKVEELEVGTRSGWVRWKPAPGGERTKIYWDEASNVQVVLSYGSNTENSLSWITNQSLPALKLRFSDGMVVEGGKSFTRGFIEGVGVFLTLQTGRSSEGLVAVTTQKNVSGLTVFERSGTGELRAVRWTIWNTTKERNEEAKQGPTAESVRWWNTATSIQVEFYTSMASKTLKYEVLGTFTDGSVATVPMLVPRFMGSTVATLTGMGETQEKKLATIAVRRKEMEERKAEEEEKLGMHWVISTVRVFFGKNEDRSGNGWGLPWSQYGTSDSFGGSPLRNEQVTWWDYESNVHVRLRLDSYGSASGRLKAKLLFADSKLSKPNEYAFGKAELEASKRGEGDAGWLAIPAGRSSEGLFEVELSSTGDGRWSVASLEVNVKSYGWVPWATITRYNEVTTDRPVSWRDHTTSLHLVISIPGQDVKALEVRGHWGHETTGSFSKVRRVTGGSEPSEDHYVVFCGRNSEGLTGLTFNTATLSSVGVLDLGNRVQSWSQRSDGSKKETSEWWSKDNLHVSVETLEPSLSRFTVKAVFRGGEEKEAVAWPRSEGVHEVVVAGTPSVSELVEVEIREDELGENATSDGWNITGLWVRNGGGTNAKEGWEEWAVKGTDSGEALVSSENPTTTTKFWDFASTTHLLITTSEGCVGCSFVVTGTYESGSGDAQQLSTTVSDPKAGEELEVMLEGRGSGELKQLLITGSKGRRATWAIEQALVNMPVLGWVEWSDDEVSEVSMSVEGGGDEEKPLKLWNVGSTALLRIAYRDAEVDAGSVEVTCGRTKKKAVRLSGVVTRGDITGGRKEVFEVNNCTAQEVVEVETSSSVSQVEVLYPWSTGWVKWEVRNATTTTTEVDSLVSAEDGDGCESEQCWWNVETAIQVRLDMVQSAAELGVKVKVVVKFAGDREGYAALLEPGPQRQQVITGKRVGAGRNEKKVEEVFLYSLNDTSGNSTELFTEGVEVYDPAAGTWSEWHGKMGLLEPDYPSVWRPNVVLLLPVETRLIPTATKAVEVQYADGSRDMVEGVEVNATSGKLSVATGRSVKKVWRVSIEGAGEKDTWAVHMGTGRGWSLLRKEKEGDDLWLVNPDFMTKSADSGRTWVIELGIPAMLTSSNVRHHVLVTFNDGQIIVAGTVVPTADRMPFHFSSPQESHKIYRVTFVRNHNDHLPPAGTSSPDVQGMVLQIAVGASTRMWRVATAASVQSAEGVVVFRRHSLKVRCRSGCGEDRRVEIQYMDGASESFEDWELKEGLEGSQDASQVLKVWMAAKELELFDRDTWVEMTAATTSKKSDGSLMEFKRREWPLVLKFKHGDETVVSSVTEFEVSLRSHDAAMVVAVVKPAWAISSGNSTYTTVRIEDFNMMDPSHIRGVKVAAHSTDDNHQWHIAEVNIYQSSGFIRGHMRRCYLTNGPDGGAMVSLDFEAFYRCDTM